MAIGEAEAFSERMKRELVALESANVYALIETESVVEEVCGLMNSVYDFSLLVIELRFQHVIKIPYKIWVFEYFTG